VTDISDNKLIAIYYPKEKLFVSTNGEKITTSQCLRANEQFKLIKSNDYWCFQSNNYAKSYISLNNSTCTINDKQGYTISTNNICSDNEKFEIIKRADIGEEYFSIRSVKYNLFLHIENYIRSFEASGNKGIVYGDIDSNSFFVFMNATQGDVI
jgi:hypothetical protein